MKLRPYQLEARESIDREWEEHQATLVVLPTGCGKTIVFAHVANDAPGRVMVVAHREELISQAAQKIATVTGERPEIEMADQRADLHMFKRSKVVVSSIQTQQGRMQRFKPRDFSRLIIDEAHHATAPTYRKVIDHYTQNPNLRVLGVTATPDRADESALGKVFGSVAFNYEIVNAINDGWLVPIRQQSVEIQGLDFSKVSTTAGDLNAGELAEVMEREKNLHGIADATLRLAKWKKTIVFATNLRHAEQLSEILNRHRHGCSRWVSGMTPKEERRQTLADFESRAFQYLINVGVLTEGFDQPKIEMVVIARPTKSRALFAQMIGRGTRPLPGVVDSHEESDDRRDAIAASAKPNVEVLDFTGNSGRHKLVTVTDILGGNYDDEVIEQATKKARESGCAVDPQEMLEETKREIHERNELEKAKERERRKRVVGKATFSTSSVDPFDVYGIEPVREHGWDTSTPPSEKQKAMLEKHGIPTDNLSKRRAGQLIQEIINRRERNVCTFKQAKILTQFGYESNVGFAEASGLIDAIIKNGWKRPEAVTA